MPDTRKDCCKLAVNLGPVVIAGKDLTYRRCLECQCRHFELVMDPGNLGLRGAPVS